MKTYLIHKGSSTQNIEVRAEDINALRKRIIRENDFTDRETIFICIPHKLLSGRIVAKPLGGLYYFGPDFFGHDEPNGAYYWGYSSNGAIMRSKISPKTGKIIKTEYAGVLSDVAKKNIEKRRPVYGPKKLNGRF